MNVQQQIEQLTTQRAVQWLEALKSGRRQEYPQFVRWVSESPRHLSEFMAVLAMSQELPGAFARAGIDRDALLKRIRANVHPLRTARDAVVPHTRTAKARWPKVAAAAVAITVLSLSLWAWLNFAVQEFSTDVGEQRVVTLADNSIVYLNARSTIKVKLNTAARDIQLLRGEALFQVARDPQRPFTVHTRDAVTRALGTRFNVDARQTRTIISVLEGKVEVSSSEAGTGHTLAQPLSAGQAAEVSREGKLERHSHADVAAEVAWRQRQLVFSKTSLEEVAADFNRFHRKGRLILQDIKPGSHHYTGTFEADDVVSFALLLAREQDLMVEQHDGDYVVRPRTQSTATSAASTL